VLTPETAYFQGQKADPKLFQGAVKNHAEADSATAAPPSGRPAAIGDEPAAMRLQCPPQRTVTSSGDAGKRLGKRWGNAENPLRTRDVLRKRLRSTLRCSMGLGANHVTDLQGLARTAIPSTFLLTHSLCLRRFFPNVDSDLAALF